MATLKIGVMKLPLIEGQAPVSECLEDGAIKNKKGLNALRTEP
jgi:hypothetical protein